MSDKLNATFMWLTPIFLAVTTLICVWREWTVVAALAGACTGFTLGVQYAQALHRRHE
jgi:hypothetical protein